jgi:hypothetical protein
MAHPLMHQTLQQRQQRGRRPYSHAMADTHPQSAGSTAPSYLLSLSLTRRVCACVRICTFVSLSLSLCVFVQVGRCCSHLPRRAYWASPWMVKTGAAWLPSDIS